MSIQDRALNKYIEVKDKEKDLDERSYRVGFIHGFTEQQKPRPIEKAPKDKKIYLCRGRSIYTCVVSPDFSVREINGFFDNLTITDFDHWLPLPDTEGL